MKNLSLVFCLFWSFAASAEYPYKILPSTYIDTPGSIKEIGPVTPIKSQDGVGLCYGFSTTSILENYRCRELKLDCSKPSEFLSSLDVTSFLTPNKRALIEGGHTFEILENIQSSNLKIVKEECAQFSTLIYKKFLFFSSSEKEGWDSLVEIWNEHNRAKDCITCSVSKLKSKLVGIQTPDEQLIKAFNASSFNEFLYTALLPKACSEEEKVASIPPFIAKKFKNDGKSSVNELKEKIEFLLKSDTPVELSICATMKVENKISTCESGHSVALFGIKQSCKLNDCKTVVKVKNSYGMSWQAQNNNGWMDLDALVESSKITGYEANIAWIERP